MQHSGAAALHARCCLSQFMGSCSPDSWLCAARKQHFGRNSSSRQAMYEHSRQEAPQTELLCISSCSRTHVRGETTLQVPFGTCSALRWRLLSVTLRGPGGHPIHETQPLALDVAQRQVAPQSLPLYLGNGGAPSRIVNDVLHCALDVAIALCCIQHTQRNSPLPVGVVGLEDGATTLSLSPDNTSHVCSRSGSWSAG